MSSRSETVENYLEELGWRRCETNDRRYSMISVFVFNEKEGQWREVIRQITNEMGAEDLVFVEAIFSFNSICKLHYISETQFKRTMATDKDWFE